MQPQNPPNPTPQTIQGPGGYPRINETSGLNPAPQPQVPTIEGPKPNSALGNKNTQPPQIQQGSSTIQSFNR